VQRALVVPDLGGRLAEDDGRRRQQPDVVLAVVAVVADARHVDVAQPGVHGAELVDLEGVRPGELRRGVDDVRVDETRASKGA
jgi:hypothetical protein